MQVKGQVVDVLHLARAICVKRVLPSDTDLPAALDTVLNGRVHRARSPQSSYCSPSVAQLPSLKKKI